MSDERIAEMQSEIQHLRAQNKRLMSVFYCPAQDRILFPDEYPVTEDLFADCCYDHGQHVYLTDNRGRIIEGQFE